MLKHEILIKAYKEERREAKLQRLNKKLLELSDMIVEEYETAVKSALKLERVIHDTVKLAEEEQ